MWCISATDLLHPPITKWVHLSRVRTETVEVVAAAAAATAKHSVLIFDFVSPESADAADTEAKLKYSDTAFACIHNAEVVPQGGSEWGLVQLDGLCVRGETALLRLFRTNESLLNFIALRYFHRMLHPLRECVYRF